MSHPWVILPANFNQAQNTQDDLYQKRKDEAENAARFANASVTQITTGTGVIRGGSACMFPITFTEEPAYTYGSGIAKGAGVNNPVGSAVVRAWARDSRGFYLGAYMTFTVDGDGSPASLQMVHHLNFSGIALKDLPNEMLSALETFIPRTPWMGF